MGCGSSVVELQQELSKAPAGSAFVAARHAQSVRSEAQEVFPRLLSNSTLHKAKDAKLDSDELDLGRLSDSDDESSLIFAQPSAIDEAVIGPRWLDATQVAQMVKAQHVNCIQGEQGKAAEDSLKEHGVASPSSRRNLPTFHRVCHPWPSSCALTPVNPLKPPVSRSNRKRSSRRRSAKTFPAEVEQLTVNSRDERQRSEGAAKWYLLPSVGTWIVSCALLPAGTKAQRGCCEMSGKEGHQTVEQPTHSHGTLSPAESVLALCNAKAAEMRDPISRWKGKAVVDGAQEDIAAVDHRNISWSAFDDEGTQQETCEQTLGMSSQLQSVLPSTAFEQTQEIVMRQPEGASHEKQKHGDWHNDAQLTQEATWETAEVLPEDWWRMEATLEVKALQELLESAVLDDEGQHEAQQVLTQRLHEADEAIYG